FMVTIKALRRKNILRDNTVPTKEEVRNQNMRFSLKKSKKQNILTVFWKDSLQICTKKQTHIRGLQVRYCFSFANQDWTMWFTDLVSHPAEAQRDSWYHTNT